MKIRKEKDGAYIVKPDFGLLREGLRMAQRTTPTAIASVEARASHDFCLTIAQVFAGTKASEMSAPCSFHTVLPSRDKNRG